MSSTPESQYPALSMMDVVSLETVVFFYDFHGLGASVQPNLRDSIDPYGTVWNRGPHPLLGRGVPTRYWEGTPGNLKQKIQKLRQSDNLFKTKCS